MRLLLALCCAGVLLLGVACSDDGGSSNDSPTVTPAATTATREANATPQATAGTPENAALVDDVIDLAVQLNTMTREQAVCVFQDHPSIYQEFLQQSGLMTSGTQDEETLRQQIEDLKREHAVQLDVCFVSAGG